MKRVWILLCLGAALLTSRAFAQPAVISLDPLIDWKNPMGLTMEKVDAFYKAQPYSKNNNWRTLQKIGEMGGGFIDRVGLVCRKGSLELKVGPGRMSVHSFSIAFKEGRLVGLDFTPDSSSYTGKDWAADVVQYIHGLVGGDPPVYSKETKQLTPAGMAPVSVTYERHVWKRSGHRLEVARRISPNMTNSWSFLALLDNGEDASTAPSPADEPPMIVEEVTEKTFTEIQADLDPLLAFDTIWKTSTDEFGKRYVAREGEKQEEPPQFEWLTTTKDRARFSRQMFSDVPTTLTLFGGEVKVEEAVVEFVNGRAGRAAISIYNRGDAGQMGSTEFQALFKKVGQSLGTVLKVAPRRQMNGGAGVVKNVAWMWTSPLGVALLEHNDFEGQGVVGKPEYLRLKLSAPDQADWTMGRMSMGVQRQALQRNVVKDMAAGDVHITGVPMVDQGAKGYCVAATCQRLFEYLRIPCDQHEMAQLLLVDAEGGANVQVMESSLTKVDQKFGVTFKPLDDIDIVESMNYVRRKLSVKQFTNLVKEHTEKGMPLLWGVELGRFPEDPPLPGGGQVKGGHMRMIIGYNSTKDQIIFTDSWGAGHEKKRMDATNAYNATLGLYSMSPRGM